MFLSFDQEDKKPCGQDVGMKFLDLVSSKIRGRQDASVVDDKLTFVAFRWYDSSVLLCTSDCFLSASRFFVFSFFSLLPLPLEQLLLVHG